MFRADAMLHRDDTERRAMNETPGRGDSSVYTAWFRNSAKIHKPVRKKTRRYAPHASGIGRSAQLAKPESPILSRIGYHPVDRGTILRQDVTIGQGARPGGVAIVGKWSAEGGPPRYGGASPRVFEREGARRGDKVSARPMSAAAASAGAASSKGDGEVSGDQTRGAGGGCPPTQSDGAAEKDAASVKPVVEDGRTTGASAVPKWQAFAKGGNSREISEENPLEKRRDEAVVRKLDPSRNSIQITTSVEGGIAAVQMREAYESKTRSESNRPSGQEASREVGTTRKDKGGLTEDGNCLQRDRQVQMSESISHAKEECRLPAERRDAPLRESILHVNGFRPDDTGKMQSENTNSARGAEEGAKSMAGEKEPKRSAGELEITERLCPPQSHLASSLGSPKRLRHDGKNVSGKTNREPVMNAPRFSEHGTPSVKLERKETQQNELKTENACKSTVKSVSTEGVGKRAKASEDPGGEMISEKSRIVERNPSQASEGPGKVWYKASSTVSEALPSDLDDPISSQKKRSEEVSKIVSRVRCLKDARTDEDELSKASSLKNSAEAKDSGSEAKEVSAQRDEALGAYVSGSLLPSFAAMNAKSSPPALPVVELRTALSSRVLHASSSLCKNSPRSRLSLRSSLPTPAIQDTKSNEVPTTPLTPRSGIVASIEPVQNSAPTSTPVASSPVPVPAPAISFLRSSPRTRSRSGTGDGIFTLQSPRFVPVSPLNKTNVTWNNSEQNSTSQKSNELVGKIHAIDERIRMVEKKLASENAFKSTYHQRTLSKEAGRRGLGGLQSAQAREKFALARSIAEREEESGYSIVQVSDDPLHASLRLVLARNQAVSAGSNAVFRPLCHDVETGLSPSSNVMAHVELPSEEIREKVTAEIARRKAIAMKRKKDLSCEYNALRESWRRKLKSAWDKKSKEKREAIRERDRFLVLCTKGQSALLSSRTSSGRMSMKIFPSLNSNGHINGNAEIDALLKEIEDEGGTPGLKETWSKTLAMVPAQNPSAVPCDCTSVLVEDPLFDFQSSRAVNPWSFEERLIFLDKFAMYPKNFRKIASFLEHKCTQDCSYFYYLNKLDLGLKQLAKEASTLKRKGVLKSHIVALAKKRLNFEPADSISSQTSTFLSSPQVSTGGLSHERHMQTEFSQLLSIQKGSAIASEKWRFSSCDETVKKRIISDCVCLDLSDIDREAFAQAVARHGADIREVSKALAIPGKTSSHYREMYRKYKRRIRSDEQDNEFFRKHGQLSRSPTPSLKQSPRLSPKSSPDTFSTPLGSRTSPLAEPEPMMLDEGTDVELASKDLRNAESPGASSPAIRLKLMNPSSGIETDSKAVQGSAASGLKLNPKAATWTPEECEKFRQLFKKYKQDWKKIAQHLAPKTCLQVKGYWRKMCHEFGSGTGDNGKISKGERKKIKRSHNGVNGSSGKQREERRSSLERSPRAEYNFKEVEKSSSCGIEGTHCDIKESLEQKRKGSAPRSNCENKLSDEVGEKVRANESKTEVENDTKIREEGCTAKSEDGRAPHNWKPPSIRSVPALMLRSVLVKESAMVGKGCAGGEGSDGLTMANEDERSKCDKLRRAAESYGVLGLIDEKVKGVSTEKEKR